MGVDEAPAGQRVVELLAQLADVDVDRAVGLAVGLAPDGAVELLAADDPALALDERGEQLELARGEVERPAAGDREELGRPDLDLAGLQEPVRSRFHRVQRATQSGNGRYVRVTGL